MQSYIEEREREVAEREAAWKAELSRRELRWIKLPAELKLMKEAASVACQALLLTMLHSKTYPFRNLEGKTDLKIRALEVVEELRTKRADKQSMLLLDAFNKDRASLPQPLPNPPPLAPIPVAAPDPRTQKMINEKLKKAKDLGEQGKVDEAQKALEEAEALKKLKIYHWTWEGCKVLNMAAEMYVGQAGFGFGISPNPPPARDNAAKLPLANSSMKNVLIPDDFGFQTTTRFQGFLLSGEHEEAATEVVHLSRLGEEWVLWTSEEFGFITPSDSISTGSSIMPHKKNPDPMELVRGKSARVIGDLVTLLTLCKGLPHAYNRDLQEDKEPVFDSVKTILGMLEVSAEFALNIIFNRDRIQNALPAGHLDATTLADYLVNKVKTCYSLALWWYLIVLMLYITVQVQI
ncbi:hypothetical protein AHAS_Ahas12G0050600 [Arachis hypogaea]